jgi:hypothetical protein
MLNYKIKEDYISFGITGRLVMCSGKVFYGLKDYMIGFYCIKNYSTRAYISELGKVIIHN